MHDLQLTPGGHVVWPSTEPAEKEGFSDPLLRAAFRRDPLEGLFALAARRVSVAEGIGWRYWRGFAETYLSALSHVPPEAGHDLPAVPSVEALNAQVEAAPPLPGGEYLNVLVLRGLWQGLNAWVAAQREHLGDLPAVFAKHAPRWQQVGRVWLHLAENRLNVEHPFAFMATFTTGVDGAGRLQHLPLGKALQRYAGAGNRAALIKLLAPLERGGKQLDWLHDLIETREIYQPTAWTPAEAYRFLSGIPDLEACGLSVRVPDWWKARPRPQVRVRIDAQKGSALGVDQLLQFRVDVALGDTPLSSADIQALMSADGALVQLKGRWVEVDAQRLRQALEHWRDVERGARAGVMNFAEGMRLLAGAPVDLQHDPADEDRAWTFVEAGDHLRTILERLRDPARVEPVHAGATLKATLRPYQQAGLNWLHLLGELGLGACLADDMGLGKTIQVLALLLRRKTDSNGCAGPNLLVIPASLLANWRVEAERFAPSLKLAFLHPAEVSAESWATLAKEGDTRLRGTDLAVTTYSMLHRLPWLADVSWNLVIADEAQALRNAETRQSRQIRKLRARARIALTGTPIENRVGDLWSLFDFLNPGLLGTAAAFKAFLRRLEVSDTPSYAPLRQLVAPYILRRMKSDRSIVSDLPDKIESNVYCALTGQQAKLYQRTVTELAQTLETVEGIARRGLVLQTLMRLKQICNHPSQASGDGLYDPADSGKFDRVAALCDELAQRQHKVLVFTQFRELIDGLARHLEGVFGRPGLVMHGATPVAKRRGIVEQFQAEGGPPFMILSLKVGGTGLNLTAASHVIHFDRWWNPAVEDQATDRAFRLGQRQNVHVHKFVTRGTIEEKIDQMLADKRSLSRELLHAGQEVNLTELSDDSLLELVRLDLTRAAA